MAEQAQTESHFVVSRGDYHIEVVDCVKGVGLYAGLVFVARRAEPRALLKSCRAATVHGAYAEAHRWLELWTDGDYRVTHPTLLTMGAH